MPSPQAATRIVARLFRADGDAAGLPVYFEAFAYTVPEAA
jgi:hypothetical protein